MIFLDTNYFLRYLLHDDEGQYLIATKLLEDGARGENDLSTSTIVIFEISWVLYTTLRKDKAAVVSTLKSIMSLSFIHIDERKLLEESLALYEKENISFADCYNLLVAKNNKAESFATFDQKLLKLYSNLK